jgi:hypothetical protein
MIRQSRRELNFFVLNSSTVCCSIVFTRRIKSAICLKFFTKKIKCENIFTATEATFRPKARTQNRPRDSGICQAPPYPRLHFLPPEAWPLELNFNFFPHRTNPIKHDGHWLLHISSFRIFVHALKLVEFTNWWWWWCNWTICLSSELSSK